MSESLKTILITVILTVFFVAIMVSFGNKNEAKARSEIKAEISKTIADTLMSSELSNRLMVVTDSLEKEIANTRRLLNDWQRLNEMLESDNKQMLDELLKDN
jgi:hypothetical protein